MCPCGIPFSWPKGGLCSRHPSLQPLCFSLRIPCLSPADDFLHPFQPPELQVLFLDAGIVLASGGIMAVDEATCLLQAIFFYIRLRGATQQKDKQRRSSNIAGLWLIKKENLENTVHPGRRMSFKIPVFQSRLFWGSEMKTKRCNFPELWESFKRTSFSKAPVIPFHWNLNTLAVKMDTLGWMCSQP